MKRIKSNWPCNEGPLDAATMLIHGGWRHSSAPFCASHTARYGQLRHRHVKWQQIYLYSTYLGYGGNKRCCTSPKQYGAEPRALAPLLSLPAKHFRVNGHG